MTRPSSTSVAARDRLFVALDTPDATAARALVARLGDTVACYKLGLELLFGGGLELARDLRAAGKVVFLDMKLLDIPNTVEGAAANIARYGFDYLTVHGHDRKTLDAAVRGRGAGRLKLLAVTVLTSLDVIDLAEQGIVDTRPVDLVVHRAQLAKAAGFDGVVASGHEAAAVRQAVGSRMLIVTPGVRPAGGAAQDQSRVMSPTGAIAAGSTHLVVGRPITGASDPVAAAKAILAEMEAADAVGAPSA